MKTIAISGIIGYDVSAAEIRQALIDAKGDDITVDIASNGGLISVGLEIYNLIRAYKGDVTSHLIGVVASMATVIALAGKKIKAERAAVFMVHNASGGAIGTRHDMEKMAAILGGFDSMMAQLYAEKSGKSIAEIQTLMDAETYYFGDEIGEAGFADEMTGDPPTDNKATALSQALALIASADETLRSFSAEDAPDKIAALLPPPVSPAGVASSAASAQAAAISQEEVLMDLNLETLKAEHPDVYALALGEGKELGMKAERARREQLLALKGTNAEGDKAVDAAIADGSDYTAAMPGIMTATLKGLGGDNPPQVGTKPPEGGAGAGDPVFASLAAKAGLSAEDIAKYAPKE